MLSTASLLWVHSNHSQITGCCAETSAVLGSMLGMAGTEKLTYDWKPQLTALSGRACDAKGAALPGLACKLPVVDVRIAAWLIRPDSYETSDNPCPPLAVWCTSCIEDTGAWHSLYIQSAGHQTIDAVAVQISLQYRQPSRCTPAHSGLVIVAATMCTVCSSE